MPRKQKEPLRSLTDEERTQLEQIARAQSLPAAQVARAKALLAVAQGRSFTQAARAAGRRSGDAVAHLVAIFNGKGLVAIFNGKGLVAIFNGKGLVAIFNGKGLVAIFNGKGLAAVVPGHGGGPTPVYGPQQRERILAHARRAPDREQDGTATWSLTTLQSALRADLPEVSTYTLWCVLRGAGLSWQKSRTWCQTGQVRRVHRGRDGIAEAVTVTDPDAEAKKS